MNDKEWEQWNKNLLQYLEDQSEELQGLLDYAQKSTDNEYWTGICRTDDFNLIKENSTGQLYVWTKKDGWHQIREYPTGYGTGKYLAELYDVSTQLISMVRNNQGWAGI